MILELRAPQRETQALCRALQRSPAMEPRAETFVDIWSLSGFGRAPGCSVLGAQYGRVRRASGAQDASWSWALSGFAWAGREKPATSGGQETVSSRERQMARLKEQLHHLRVRIERQGESVRKHSEQLRLMVDEILRDLKRRSLPRELNTASSVLRSSRRVPSPARWPLAWAPRPPAVSVVDHEDLQTSDGNGGDDAGMDLDQGLEGGLTPSPRPAGPPPSSFQLPPGPPPDTNYFENGAPKGAMHSW